MFAYAPDKIAALEDAISSDRLSTYLKVTRGEKQKALALYLWNSEISAAFYMPLQGLEITLRNFLHQALTIYFKRNDWYDTGFLNPKGQEMVQIAKDAIRRNGRTVDAPHIVAELSFGFWISLLNKTYHPTLWIPVLGKKFSTAKLPRGDIQTNFENIRILRNRIAHHECIASRDLAMDYTTAIKIMRWMNPVKADWIDAHAKVQDCLAKRP